MTALSGAEIAATLGLFWLVCALVGVFIREPDRYLLWGSSSTVVMTLGMLLLPSIRTLPAFITTVVCAAYTWSIWMGRGRPTE